MLTVITALLGLSALYCGGMWLWLAGLSFFKRKSYPLEVLIEFERQTFHLGLCLILCVGFLGLILTGGADVHLNP